ncbi:MAG TPA: M56 family metallopeptidase, partial [Mucilaginibacter sp.]
APANKLYFTISGYMPWLTMVYVVGVVFNALRLTLAWNNIYRIRQNISDAGFDNTIKRLSKSLQIGKHVQAAFSEWVDVPCVTGFIKPIILMPAAITLRLSTEEVEAVLLHELAHVKRNDYLLNFIQQVIGILLFFNPFARLVGKIINEERENCCDDMVVRVTGSPFIYVQALLKLEENKQYQWQLALAATTKKYALLNRIERIMKTKTHTVNIRPVLITLLALTFSITSIAWLNPEIKDGKVVIKNAPAIRMIAKAIAAPEPPAASVPPTPAHHKKHLSIKYLSDTTKAATDTIIKNKKYKIVVEDENGVKTEYNSVNDLPADDKNAFLNKGAFGTFNISPDDTVRLNQIKKFYQSDAWKHQVEAMTKNSEKFAKQFSSPKFKKHMEKMTGYYSSPKFQKSVEDMAKAVTGPDFQKHAKEFTDQFNSPEFKKSVEQMAKYYGSPEFKKSIEDMTKYYDSPEFKKSMEGMAKYYDSPEFKKNMEDMAKQYDSPEFKKSMEDMGKSIEDLSRSLGADSSSKGKKAARAKAIKNIKESYQKAVKAEKEKKDAFNYQEQAKKDQVKAHKTEKKAQKDQAEKKFDYKKSPDTDLRIDEGKQDTNKNHNESFLLYTPM